MKSKFGILFAIVLLALMVIPVSAALIPTISIVNVVQNQSVTIQTQNFPANDTFDVTMGLSGTQGIGGVLVSRFTSGSGGYMLVKFQIPTELQGQGVISIRLQSIYSPYYSFNWFYNSTASGSPVATAYPNYPYYPYNPYYPYYPVPTAIPHVSHPTTYFDILPTSIKRVSISVRIVNFPADRTYMVLMKDGSSLATTWYGVTEFNSADGGIFNATFSIPTQLQYVEKIAVKIMDEANGVFTYNLFDNRSYP